MDIANANQIWQEQVSVVQFRGKNCSIESMASVLHEYEDNSGSFGKLLCWLRQWWQVSCGSTVLGTGTSTQFEKTDGFPQGLCPHSHCPSLKLPRVP